MKEMKRKILLTGGTGFVGSFLAHRLLQEGYEIKFLARPNKHQSAQQRIDDTLNFVKSSFHFKNQYEVIEGDITNHNLGIKESDLTKLRGQIDEVWHCAAFISFREEDADKTYNINVLGTKNVLEFMNGIKTKRLHYLSTAFVCGNRLGIVYEDELDCGQKFRNPYEQTKFEAEKLVNEWKIKKEIEATIYRLGIVVGESHSGKTLNYFGYYEFMKAFYDLRKKVEKQLLEYGNCYNEKGIVEMNDKLKIPVRMPCNLQSEINLITIDFAIDIISKVAVKMESKGKTFHVINQNAPVFKWLFETSTKYLGLTGFKLIDIKKNAYVSILLSRSRTIGLLKKILLKEMELDILNECGQYLPYALGEPKFDDSNVKKILGNVAHPLITEEQISTLLSYAIKTEFGRISV